MEGVIRWFPLDRLGVLEEAIAAALRSKRESRRRDAIGVALGLHGLRVGEVRISEQRDFFPAVRMLEVRTIKNGRLRRVPLHPTLVAAVQAELSARTVRSGLLLCTCSGRKLAAKQMQQLAGEIFDRCLGPCHGLSFHSLRHTFAMRLYSETKDILLVQRMLGHKSLTNTLVYARSLDSIPDSCLVRVGESVIAPAESPWPGQQLRLFEG
jgi:integrase/recombinase XerD